MFKHILLATDGSDLAERAASQGLELAKRLEARVTAVAVAEPWSAMGLDCATIHMKGRLPDEGIIAASEDNDCDLIVMGSHGRRGFSRLLLGSVATRVVTLSPVPVLICR